MAPPDQSRSRLSRRAQSWIFVLALLLRLGLVLTQHTWRIFFGVTEPGDQPLYSALADSLLAGGGFAVTPHLVSQLPGGYPFATGPTAWVMPGYPLFLAACRLMFGTSVLSVEIMQGVLGAAAAVWIARTSAMLFGPRAGVIGGLVAACYVELVFNTFGLHTEPLYTALIAGALCALVTAATHDTPRPRAFFKAGLLFGLAALVRPPALAIALGLAAVMLARSLHRQRLERIVHALAFAGACVAVLFPWGVRNQIVMGRFNLVAAESGFVFWLGNNPAYDRLLVDFQRLGGYAPALQFEPVPQTAGKTEMEIDRIYQNAAVGHIAAHPVLWLARMPHKMWNMWRPLLSTSSFRHRVVGYPSYLAMIAASSLGLLLAWNRRGAWLLWTFLLLNIGLHAVVTGAVRFRLPLWPALIPFAAVGVERAGEAIRRITAAGKTRRTGAFDS